MFGKVAGEAAAAFAGSAPVRSDRGVRREADVAASRLEAMLRSDKGERVATLRDAMGDCMEAGVGIFRNESGMQRRLQHAGGFARPLPRRHPAGRP